MSIYEKAGIALVPSGYKASKLYSTLPKNGVGDFDFTRATTATRVNSDGLIESVGINEPRLDYPIVNGVVQATPFLLLEPARTNFILYSEDFSQSSWVKVVAGTGSTAIVTSDYSTSPDGTQNATRLQCDLNGGLTSSVNQSLIYDTISGSGDTSGFIYVKSNTTSSQNFYLSNSLNDFVIGVATTEWQKFELNWVAAGNGRTFGIGTRGTTGSDDTLDLLIWGAQVEEGSYATSYIPTSGSTVTRNADVANGAGDASTFNDSEGVLFADLNFLANDSVIEGFSVSDGSSSDRAVIFKFNSSNLLRVRLSSNSVNVIDANVNVSDITEPRKMALKYKANESSFWMNGFEIFTAPSVTSMPIGLNQLGFDSDGIGSAALNGKTKQLMTFKEALTDAELENLTSWDSFIELAQGQQYIIY